MIDAGRIVPLPKGTYDAETQYEILDFVFYPVDGNTYVATQTTIGNAPSQESAYWQLLAQGSVVDITLDSESGRPVANSVITNALLNKLNIDGALDNNVVNTFNSIQDTLPVPTVGDTQSTLWGKVIKWFADARNRFLSSTGDVSSTTVAQFTDYESESWPQPEAGETMSSLMGKIASFFNTSRWFFTQHGLTKGSLKNNGTTTEVGVYALDARYGKTLADEVASLNSRVPTIEKWTSSVAAADITLNAWVNVTSISRETGYAHIVICRASFGAPSGRYVINQTRGLQSECAQSGSANAVSGLNVNAFEGDNVAGVLQYYFTVRPTSAVTFQIDHIKFPI